jgi:diguanylate cyclase (GGDEF)-like protein
MSPRRLLQVIVAASTVVSFIAAAGAMYVATARYELATRTAQVERVSNFVERYVREVVWHKHADDVQTLADDIANEGRLRAALAASDRDAVARMLPTVGRRYAVTSGHIALRGITVYDANGGVVAEHMSERGLRASDTLSNLLAARTGKDRLAQLRHVWTLYGVPYLSVVVPVGGLRQITGYVAVHVDPLHALRGLDNYLAMHVLLTSVEGAHPLAELDQYAVPENSAKRYAEVLIDSPEGEPAFRVEMQADTSAATHRMAAIRAWSFLVLFAALTVIAAATTALVLLVSRRMARQEAAAANAALEAVRIEERNADLQRHNAVLRESEEALEAQNQRFAAALNNMAHGMCMFDKDKRLVVCNNLYLEMYGLARELGRPGTPLRAILEARIASRASPRDASHVEEILAEVSHGEPRYTVRELRDGRIMAVAYQPMDGGGWVVVHQDVTAQKRAEIEIAHMARHDALTGLANRLLLREKMDEALARLRHDGEKFGVLVLDLNRFKAVNDTLGHPIGDALLVQVAQRLGDIVRKTDTVARLGGDEFAILTAIDGDPVQGLTALAERLLVAIAAPYQIEDHHAVVATSVGIAIAPDNGTEAADLLRNADLALYRAKTGAMGYCFFQTEMYDQARVLQGLETDLRAAVERQEFELHYQPIINAATKAIIGAEALVRWRHPERGLIPPAEFIHLAERTGLIEPLGDWVLRKACADAVGWPSHVKLAVNLSPAQFKCAKLVESVAAALGRSGLAPERLELEITETVILHKDATNIAILHELGRLGVSVVLDDFGTGYSSLSHLHMYPFHKIKIDKSFIDDLPTRDGRAAIVVAITGLARNLDIITTAEGVETASQFELLRAAGCNEVQGYLFGRPCPLSELTFEPRERRSKGRQSYTRGATLTPGGGGISSGTKKSGCSGSLASTR